MAFSALIVQAMISAPGDIPEVHRGAIHSAMRRWNIDHGKMHSIIFLPADWTEGSTPGVAGEYAQELINEQLVDVSDLAIVVYTDKLGTPTPVSGSGTVEETDRFIDAGKEVLTYRNLVPRTPLRGESANAEKLRLEEYLSDVQRRALVGSYTSPEEFELKLQSDLTKIATKFKASLELSTQFTRLPSPAEAALEAIESAAVSPTHTQPEPSDLTEYGIWPRVETSERAESDSRGRLRTRRSYHLVLESNIPYSVEQITFHLEDGEGNEIDMPRVINEGPIERMAPLGKYSAPMFVAMSTPSRVICVVRWQDKSTARETRTTLAV
ncbi:hypothetical protein FQ330_00235 [Agrococcus sediminis]|uniref:DUF4062 domain-containing protein n=1 Tax=Agrococcus sediminis TaxID=2599924 RepID=A0A5M8QPG3_9MICO|nr:hypothetical protein [Agrococcus sediminis]KAA6437959.1 hypothetical protein FQ330_00235 [Agrococcus sediminis]